MSTLKKVLKAHGPLIGVGTVSLVIVLIGLLLWFGLSVSRSWKEEVRLINGSVIVIKRYKVRERFGEIGQHGPLVKEELTFSKPGSKIHWVGDINPVVFDFVKGRAYVVAFPQVYAECQRYGHPNPPFVFFEYSEQEWKRIRAQEFPDGLAFNLLRKVWYEDQPSPITLDMKEQRDWNPPEYFKKFDKNLKMNCGGY